MPIIDPIKETLNIIEEFLNKCLIDSLSECEYDIFEVQIEIISAVGALGNVGVSAEQNITLGEGRGILLTKQMAVSSKQIQSVYV